MTVTDTSSPEDLAESVATVSDLPGVSLVLGKHREQDFGRTDLVVANPAVKPTNPYLQIAHDAGVPVTTEICLLVRALPNRLRTIGITGSAGKSTTTAMVGHILRKAFAQEGETPDVSGDQPGVWVGGNLGGSLLPIVDQIRDDDWVVLELSSFMLHYLREEKWSPHIAVVTNLSPNHLDWHGTMEEYAACKAGLLAFQASGDRYVMGSADMPGVPVPRDRVGSLPGGRKQSGDLSRLSEATVLAVPGEHNRTNAALACAAVRYAWDGSGAGAAGVAESPGFPESWLADFAGLPHRLAYVGELSEGAAGAVGVRCFNDSKSTTPEAAVLAMEAFEAGTVHAILGGYDKGADLSAMCRVAAARCAGLYGIGGDGGGNRGSGGFITRFGGGRLRDVGGGGGGDSEACENGRRGAAFAGVCVVGSVCELRGARGAIYSTRARRLRVTSGRCGVSLHRT